MKGRFVQAVILLLVALAIIYLFQKDILSLLGGIGDSIFKNYLEKVIIFLVDLASKLFALIRSVFSYLAGIVLKIVGNAAELYKLINGVLWIFGKLFSLLKSLFSFISGVI